MDKWVHWFSHWANQPVGQVIGIMIVGAIVITLLAIFGPGDGLIETSEAFKSRKRLIKLKPPLPPPP